MEVEQLLKLFPLKGEVTQAIINIADPSDVQKCIGARTLIAAMGESFSGSVSWGRSSGTINQRGALLDIATDDGIDMMEIKSPQEVTFVVRRAYLQ